MFSAGGIRLVALTVLAALASIGRGSQPPAFRRVPLVVTGGIVITMDAARRVLAPGAVAIAGTDIVAVGAPDVINAGFRGDEIIDATGDVILPGLINTHTHAPMVLFRGLADDLALLEWLQKYIFPAEARTVSPEFVRIGTRLAALEMIESGTTSYVDMYYFEEEIARVTKEAGLRGVLGQTVIDFPVPDARTPAEALGRAEAFIQRFINDELIVPAVAPHSMYTVDARWLTASRALATKYAVPVLIHLAETQDEIRISNQRFRATPVDYLESLGFWGPRTVAAHGVWVTEQGIGTLQRHHVGISNNPESNMKLASGTAPVPKYLAAGIAVGLGTDGAASNNDLDMFEAMRQSSFQQKLATGDPRVVPAATALEMATIGGARVLGMERLIGSLEPGKRADVIVVSMSAARQTPMYDPISHLVYVTRGDDVRTTIVNGKVLMRDRKVLTLDEAAVLTDARAVSERVRKAVR
jgi:5-methylthioadenosine/S-adenosylhomocysteine deaminase